jgi:hypothetical protein
MKHGTIMSDDLGFMTKSGTIFLYQTLSRLFFQNLFVALEYRVLFGRSRESLPKNGIYTEKSA